MEWVVNSKNIKIFLATSQQSHFGLVGKVLIVAKNVTVLLFLRKESWVALFYLYQINI